ncbi:MAG: SPOR domain-containing protein [Gammaproteobacteria bacterium]|nr:SPOR domain-containing protein [Gammaproteobacteria bacterium]
MKDFASIKLIVAVFGFFVMLSSSAMADLYQDAVKATAERDYERALSLWQKLARNGDPVAQYNLAVFYREGYGIKADRSTSNRFLKTAVKGGLIEAANKLNSDTIQPADKAEVESVIAQYKSDTLSPSLLLSAKAEIPAEELKDPQGWVMAQNPKHYTLQLVSSRSEDRVKKVFDSNNMTGKGGYYKQERNGEVWYFLIYGAYKSSDEATSRISELPEEIQKSSPWVRQLKNIQRNIRKSNKS